MEETNYFGPVKIEPSSRQNYEDNYFGDQEPCYPGTELFEQKPVPEPAFSNSYSSSIEIPQISSSSRNSGTTTIPTNPTQSTMHRKYPNTSLLNGKIAVIKLERIDPTKYLTSTSQNNSTQNFGRYNLRRTVKEAKSLQTGLTNDHHSNQSSNDSSDNEDNTSTNSTDNEKDPDPPKFRRKPRGFVESFPLIEKLKIPDFHGNFPCIFCSTSKEYAAELAVHEALHHSKTTTYKRDPKPGQHSKRRHRHHCPRCQYTASRRHYYVVHHLKEHLGFSDDKLINVRNIFTFTTPQSNPSKTLEPCEICQMCILNQPKTKSNHFKTYHDLSQLKPGDTSQNCSQCPAYFLRGIHLVKHQQNVHSSVQITSRNKKSHPCKNCPQKFHSLRKLWTHRRNHCEMRHTFNWIATCEIEGCSSEEKFESTAELDYHVTHYHHGHQFKAKSMICPHCGRTCIGEIGLRRHMKIHNGDDDNTLESDWKCKDCPGKEFKSRILFKKHLKYHKGGSGTNTGSNHMCDQCGKTFRVKSLLERHYSFHKDPDSWKWSCKICGNNFSTKQALQLHQRIHTGEKPFECTVCKERFRYRHILRVHVNRNHGNDGILDVPRNIQTNKLKEEDVKLLLEFRCDICSKSFASKQAMQLHTRLHTGEMPFECEVCKKRFRHRHILRMHVNQNHGKDGILDIPKQYQKEKLKKEDVKLLLEFRCEICSKSFASKQAMQLHVRLHTGEKPYCCGVCGERFTYRRSLNSHVNTKHEQDGNQKLIKT